MADPHAIDTERLAHWLRAHVADVDGALTAEKFEGGQSNPTYRLAVDRAVRWVLRKKPPGVLLPSAHAIDREYRIIGALADSAVPVPRVHGWCDDPDIVGTPFYIMDHVSGRSFADPRLPGVDRDQRTAIYGEMARVLAALHRVDPARHGLADFGRPGNYFARQVARWTRQYRATETEPIDAMERLIAWLPDHIPAGDETTLVHGDYRIDNLILDPVAPRIVAVLDWELSTLGHPLADLAYNVMAWRLSSEMFGGLGGCDLAALGIPDENAQRDTCLRLAGRDDVAPAAWEYAMAYNMFRIACIRQGVLFRALQGNASNDRALDAGRKTRAMAEMAWAQSERVG